MPRERKRKRSKRHAKKRGRDTSSSSSSSNTSYSSSSSSTNSSSSSEHVSRKRRKRGRKGSPTVSQNVVLASVIPEYDPLVDDIDMWLNVVQANARAFGWSDNMVKYQALQKLRNSAKTWLDSLQKNETRWTSWRWRQWRNTLSDTFQTKRCMYTLIKQLVDTKPLPNQSLYEFFFQQKGKIDRLQLRFSERDINSIIVGSIGDSSISTAVEAGNFRYCDDLAAFLHGRTFTTTEKSPIQKNYSHTTPKPTYRYGSSSGGSSSQNYNTKSEPTIKTESTPIIVNSNHPTNVCYRCGEPGHKRNTCPVKDNIRCASCSKLGHLEAACKSKLKHKPEEVKMIHSNSQSKEKFYKKVDLNNTECNAFFDMGSDCSLVTTELVKQCSLTPFKINKPITLVGFTNDYSVQVTEAVVANFKVDSVQLFITLYVVDMLAGCDLLIGRNFTEDRSIMYTRIGDILTFEPVQVLGVNNIDINLINGVSEEHRAIINNILSKYPQCTSQNLAGLGKTSCVELSIELTSNKPVCQRPYRMSESEKVKTRELTDELLKNGIIRHSCSAYASPALLVDKPSGEKRLCIDYRQLNKITVKEKYPMPVIDDLIDRLRGCKFYTSLDLKNGYYQIGVKSEDAHKLAFVTSDSHFEFIRMPFGVCNGPAVFQRLMNTILGKLRFGKVICYMDDLLIATETLEENIACLEQVLHLLSANGLTLNLEKCSFFRNDITFLGYEISEHGIRPSSKKLKALVDYPSPTTVHQLRQFLGLVNYFRKFIKNCAVICKPLTNLLKKGVSWHWGSEHDKVVTDLKEKLINNAVLKIFDPKLPINLYTDASQDGIGCILMQLTEKGERPVHFYSRQTTKDEKKFHSFELELLAIVTGLQRFRHYLIGTQFKITTDCNAVKHALSKQNIVPRISRWVLYTQEFTFEVAHRAGCQMQHVDALSRNPLKDNNETVSVMSITEGDWLLSVQLQDPGICSIREILLSGQAESNKRIFNEYEVLGNKVYRRTEYGRRWLVPKSCVWNVIRTNHDDIGHFAVDKTIERIRSKYWFPHLKKTVSKYIKNCLNCIYYKNIHGKKPGKLFPIPKYARPFHTLHVDHLGPFVKTTQQNSYLLVLVDSFTKFVFISAVKNTKSTVVINELNKLFKIFGNPKRLVCDAGSAFTSRLFTEYCNARYIRRHIIATAVPRSNGQVERYNFTILEALRSMGADTENNKWDLHISSIQQGINSTVNKTTAAVPSEVFFGYRIRMNNDAIIDDSLENVIDVTALRNTVDNNIKKDAERQKASFDAKRKEATQYKVGDLVVLKIPSQSNDGQSTKLLPLYKGPFQITEILGNDRYKVADLRGAERSSKRYDGTACVENMKPWIHIKEQPDVVDEIKASSSGHDEFQE